LNFAAAFLLLATSVSLTPQQRAEVKRLDDSLLAPCCYTQPISQHLSDAAEEMRQQVDEMVASGMGDREIGGARREYRAGALCDSRGSILRLLGNPLFLPA